MQSTARVRIKICGLTRREDVCSVAHAGADAIGLVFYPRSPRFLSVTQAQTLAAAAPAFLTVTGLFLDARAEEVQRTLAAVRLDLLQFHGDEPPEFCRAFGRPYIKAIAMGARPDLEECARRYHDAAGLMLDSHSAGGAGGTGATFDWRGVIAPAGMPLILAGGLTAANVAEAIRCVWPYAVDVSSGVETAPGIKDRAKIMGFVHEVNRAASA
ncbi:MAG: phosphoribosylanthranilate isomerase [Gammaproteobacteria bacterium]